MTAITLRKAANYAKLLLTASKQVSLKTSTSVSIYATTSLSEVVAQARDSLAESLQGAVALSEAGYRLRRLIGDANVMEVNALLNEKASLDAQEKLLTSVWTSQNAGLVLDVAIGRLDALKARYAANGYGEDEIDLRVPAPDDLADRIYAARLRKTEIDETLLGLNTNTKITLPDDIKALMLRYKLI